jgi:4-oxalmesaconate hydratase
MQRTGAGWKTVPPGGTLLRTRSLPHTVRLMSNLHPIVVDCHGHYTTAPAALAAWRDRQVAAVASGRPEPRASELSISDEELRESLEGAQLLLQRERGTDLTIFSPRASFMAHHVGNAGTSAAWAALCNEMIQRVVALYPARFAGACMLPQSPGVRPEHCIAELDRCIEEFGFVACNLNPDPSGGHWREPPLTDRWWYPLYERLVELDVPAMVHVSTSCNACFHTTGAHYLNADTTAFMQFLDSDLFRDFPTLRFVIPHGGGAVPYHWGRFRGLAQALKRPRLTEHLLGNVFFDTCVYHQPGIDLLLDVIPHDNILFGAEMVGAVRGIDDETGFHFDDTKRYLDARTDLSMESRFKIFEGNARRVYPRLSRLLDMHNPRPLTEAAR